MEAFSLVVGEGGTCAGAVGHAARSRLAALLADHAVGRNLYQIFISTRFPSNGWVKAIRVLSSLRLNTMCAQHISSPIAAAMENGLNGSDGAKGCASAPSSPSSPGADRIGSFAMEPGPGAPFTSPLFQTVSRRA